MPKFEEITKEEWDYLKGKFDHVFKDELPTNTYKDIYTKFFINKMETMGRERQYYNPPHSKFYLWR